MLVDGIHLNRPGGGFGPGPGVVRALARGRTFLPLDPPYPSCAAGELRLERDAAPLDGIRRRCTNQCCRAAFSARIGSKFEEHGHFSMFQQLQLMVALWNGRSARCAARTFGVDHNAAFTYFGRFRRACSNAWLLSGGDSGFRPGEVFEVDETQVRGVWAESVRGK